MNQINLTIRKKIHIIETELVRIAYNLKTDKREINNGNHGSL